MRFKELEIEISFRLKNSGFIFKSEKKTGLVYVNQQKSICLKVDISICEIAEYPYVSYTSEQNSLVHKYNLFLRFSINSIDDLDRLEQELDFFTSEEPEADKLRQYGTNRQEQEIDPSLPEATFEDSFAQAFGEKSLYALSREEIYHDYDGKRRFIDYVLKTSVRSYAIELNGEQFHHPVAIKENRYQSQLFKQNSLAAQGYKVFRWSQRGMADREKFIQEIKLYFGDPLLFDNSPHFKSLRSLKTFHLADHQHDALNYIDSLRDQGRNTFIIVLPTATGKTEIFIEDLYRQQLNKNEHKALIMVPRKNLKQQTIERFNSRYPDLNIDENIFSNNDQHICIQTYAYLLRHYHEVAIDRFDYIVVDEAHHAQASGLKKVLEYFNPGSLLGFTATDERLDKKRLEDIFGQYETQMTLKEAMQKLIVPPVSVYRLETNIDLSNVRYNGKDFVKSDLQRNIQIPSRDEMIVRLMVEHFSQPLLNGTSLKQGLIFCVDIKHAKRIARLLNEASLKAAAVSGVDRDKSDKALKAYANKEIQFLCACDLLNEGWDSPQTSILVMARPTMSKVLYMQQLGRGTRHHKDKERLYVIDVVDSYGAQLQPWSAHGLLKIECYLPFGNLLGIDSGSLSSELHILTGLYEQVVRMIPLDMFTMQENLEDMLSIEQLARELFVSTGTVKNWLKKGDIGSDVTLPFGNRHLYFFSVSTVETIRKQKNLSLHTDKTRREDFYNFIEERDYTFSYKIIFLCLMFKMANDRGEVDIEELTRKYSDFYLEVLSKYKKADRPKSPYNNKGVLSDQAKIQKSILQNPFEKFERKRFMHHCKDLKYISYDSVLWSGFSVTDKTRVQKQMFEDLDNYYQQLDIIISQQLKSQIQFLEIDEPKDIKESLIVDSYVKEENTPYVPFYPLEIAAGGFADSRVMDNAQHWINIKNIVLRHALTDDLFVSKIHGQSMEPLIPDGSYCLFRYGVAGSRNNKALLVKKDGIIDPDLQTSFTIKRYFSEKKPNSEYGWIHQKIELRPENPDYEAITIEQDNAEDFTVVAEFLSVMDLDNE